MANKRQIAYVVLALTVLILGMILAATLNPRLTVYAADGIAEIDEDIPIIDTLGEATSSTQFSIYGSGGMVIYGENIEVRPNQFGLYFGPEFTLLHPTTITEIGAFINNFGANGNLPFTVQIHPSTNGVPDPSIVLGSFILSDDQNPYIYSYESVQTGSSTPVTLILEPGSYFALFAPLDGNDHGVLLGGASDPFEYQAGSSNFGILTVSSGSTSVYYGYGAVRILGIPSPTPLVVDIDIKPGSDPNSINCSNTSGVIPVAILSTDDFDATTVDHTTVTFEGASETHVNRKMGEAIRHVEDVDLDGDMDLVFHFRLGDTALTCDSTEGTLTGETYDGMSIEGSDSIRVIDQDGS